MNACAPSRAQACKIGSRLFGGPACASIAVLTVWAVMTAADVAFVAHFGRNCPYVDDWSIAQVMCGLKPALPWIFDNGFGHVLIAPKLLWLACHAVSGLNYLSVPYASVALLSGVALALVSTARQIRGQIAWTDVVLPVVLLSWG